MARRERPDHAAEVRRALVDPWQLCQQLRLTEGYKPERQARGLNIRCPAHGDRGPSCSVTTGPDGTIRVKCFGCDLAGDVFSLVAAAYRLDTRRDFPAVLQAAADLAGISLDTKAPRSPRLVPPQPVPPQRPALVDAETFQAVALELLTRCPLTGSVRVGLASRGILAEAIADGWGELPHNVSKAGEERERDARAGFALDDPAADELVAPLRKRFEERALCWLLDRRGGLAHPQHRLLIPWRTTAGEIWGLQRRLAPRYADEEPEQGPKYLWTSRQHYSPATVYPYGANSPDLAEAAEVWLCEGAVDALALRALNRAGLLGKGGARRSMAVLGLPGVKAWGTYREQVLGHLRGRDMVVALDADGAGRAAVEGVGADAHRAGARSVGDKKPPAWAKDWAEVSARKLWHERDPR